MSTAPPERPVKDGLAPPGPFPRPAGPMPGRSVPPSVAGPYRWATAAGRRRSLRRRRLRRTVTVAVALVALVALVATVGSGGTAPLVVRVALGASPTGGVATAAAPVALPWPATGASAVTIPLLGYGAVSGPEQPVPVASLTKLVTAYVVLHDHPIPAGGHGPAIVVTAADASNFGTDTVSDQANVEMQAGEVLTEYQLLAGLLVRSANDFAYALANWDAGSVTAFVARMNTAAAALGMARSHFTDASGFAPTSQSTAADLLKVTAADMDDPVFARIVEMPSVTLPVAGTVGSYTPLVGSGGVVGVKSGFTSAAGGGDVLAYRSSVGGRTVTVLAAVTSQEGPTVLDAAANEALAVARAVVARVTPEVVATAGRVVGQVVGGPRAVPVTTAAPATLLVAPGATVRHAVHLGRPPARGAPAGTRVGTVTFTAGNQTVSVPLRTGAPLG